MKKLKQQKGITLVALVITIILLLILAGVAIGTLGGENGLFAKVKKAKEAHIKAEMKEQLILAVHNLQAEKQGKATLDDVTQQWISNEIPDYSPVIIEDPSINGKIVIMTKDGVTGKFLIDQDLNITEIEYNQSNLDFSYDTIKIVSTNKVQILIHVRDKVNGLTEVEFPDQAPFIAYGTKDEQQIYYEVELGKEYKLIITTEDGNKEEKIIKIDDYYYNVTKTLGDKVVIDNNTTKAAYNKAYEANITTEEDYGITGLTVTMGGKAVTTAGSDIVDITTGKIYIEKVTGDIEITVTSKKLAIQYTAIAISTDNSASNTSSVKDNSQTRGTTLYINIIANLEGVACTVTLKDDITKTVPYEVTTNGKYTFIVTGTYNGKTISEEKEVTVNKYQSATGLVKYDAGTWTQPEIDALIADKLYEYNSTYTNNSTFKLNDDSGLNFTFGGFQAGDSRNSSVNSEGGTPIYDGWRIFEIKDSSGNVIKNYDEISSKLNNLDSETIYVTKIIHSGCPENFVFSLTGDYDANRAEFLLSSGTRQEGYGTLSDGTPINPRRWDMYMDVDQSDLVEEIHMETYSELVGGDAGFRKIGKVSYWIAYAYNKTGLEYAHKYRRFCYSESLLGRPSCG